MSFGFVIATKLRNLAQYEIKHRKILLHLFLAHGMMVVIQNYICYVMKTERDRK